jgi:hypothetical protein
MTLLKLASENTRKQGKNTVEHIVNYYVIYNNGQKLPKIKEGHPHRSLAVAMGPTHILDPPLI